MRGCLFDAKLTVISVLPFDRGAEVFSSPLMARLSLRSFRSGET
jgi:hypothetical protein